MGVKLFKVQRNDGETLTGEVFSGDIQQADLYQQEGFHHIPIADADGILIPIGHGASHGVVVCPGRRDAISNGGGETVIYSVASSGEVKAQITLDTEGNVVIDAPGGATIKLGAGAVEPVIKGTVYTNAESVFLTALNTVIGALKTYILAIQPVADPGNAATPILSAAIDTFVTAISTFTSALSSALSTKSFTE